MHDDTKANIQPTTGMPSSLDLAFSIFLVAASLALILYSFTLSLPVVELGNATFYTGPGFLLLVISLLILILSSAQTVILVRKKARITGSDLTRIVLWFRSTRFRMTASVFIFLGLYMWVFWSTVPGTYLRVPFWLVTFCFLVAMMLVFRAASPIRILLISLIFTAVVDGCFRYLIGVPLP